MVRTIADQELVTRVFVLESLQNTNSQNEIAAAH